MFSNSTRWEVQEESVQLNNAPSETSVPKKTLRDKQSSTLISVYPYRVMYDSYIPTDSFCCLEIHLTTLNSFLLLLDNRELCVTQCKEKTDTRCKWIFHIKNDIDLLSNLLDKLEDYLLKSISEYRVNLNNEFNKLRKFISIPARVARQDVPAIKDNTAEEKSKIQTEKLSVKRKANEDDEQPNKKTPVTSEKNSDDNPPEDFFCPIMLTLMRDPVVLPSGNTCERSTALKLTHDPFSRELITNALPSNLAIKNQIDAWLKNHPGYLEKTDENAEHSQSPRLFR